MAPNFKMLRGVDLSECVLDLLEIRIIPPTIMNAVMDAVSVYGVAEIDMPATPARVWSAIQAACKNDASGKA